MRRTGVLGGTFNPIHHGHLVSAEIAAAAFGLDRVLLVPAAQNPLKAQAPADASHRLAMTRCGAAGNPLLRVSTVELDRPPPSYTVDTLALLARANPRDELYLLVGADALPDFADWREPLRVLDLCQLIVLSRPGYLLEVPTGVAAALGPRVDRIHLQPMPELAISSTDLRRRFAAGEPVRYLLPDSVEQYVRERGLYGATTRRQRHT